MQITIPATPVPVKSYPMKSSFENMAAKAIRVVCKVATHRPIIKQKNKLTTYFAAVAGFLGELKILREFNIISDFLRLFPSLS